MVAPGLTIEQSERSGWMFVTASGEIDLATAPDLEKHIVGSLAGRSDAKGVVVDLSEIDFIDSTGLRTLITAQQQMSTAGLEFVLVYGAGAVRRLLEVTSLTGSFRTVSSPDQILE